MKWKLISGAIIIYLISFIVPIIIFSRCDSEDYLGRAISISSSIATFLTVIIVILFFDKYGLSKTVFDKSQEQMIKLIDEICQIKIRGFFTVDNEEGFLNFTFSNTSLITFKNHENIADRQVLFSDNYWAGFDAISRIQRSIWTPKKIRKKLGQIIPNTALKLDDLSLRESLVLSFNDNREAVYTFIRLESQELITMKEYATLCEDLLNEINKWLKKYGGKPNEFVF